MNRIVTGAIAGAAAVLLLLGGAGTFALWNSNANANAASVSSGTLTLATAGAGTWTDTTNGRNATVSPASILMVPGNSYTFTQPLTVTATGTALKAELTYSDASITGDSALLAATTRTLQVSSPSANITSSPKANTFVVSPSASSSTVNVVFTTSLPQAATTGQNGTVNLSNLTFTLTQTAIGS
jgi:alternate signal-mediated exported protein